jgi:hypothetical protein
VSLVTAPRAMLVGESVQVKPAEGETVAVSEMVPVKPLKPETVIVEDPAELEGTLRVVGFAAMLKSWTAKVTVVL